MNRREEVMKKLLVVVVSVVLLGLSQVRASTVDWSAAGSTGAQLADGSTPIPQGDFIGLGYFASGGVDLTGAQIAALNTQAGFVTLQSDWVQYASGVMGDGTGLNGLFAREDSNANAAFNPPHRIYIWMVDTASLAGATQQAVVTAVAT